MNKSITCDCSVWDDGDMPVIYREDAYRARHQYRCCECKAFIKPGEMYSYITGLWPGQGWASFRTCLPCARIRNDLCSDGSPIGALRDIIRECLGFDYVTGEHTTDFETDEEAWMDDEELAEWHAAQEKKRKDREPKLPLRGGW